MDNEARILDVSGHLPETINEDGNDTCTLLSVGAELCQNMYIQTENYIGG